MRIRADTKDVRRGLKETRSGIRGLGTSLKRIGMIASGIILADLFRSAARALQRFVGSVIEGTGQLQRLRLQFETLAGGAAPELMDQFRRLSILSPFRTEVVQNAMRMTLAFDIAADRAADVTEGILNVGAGLGLTGEQMNRFSLNLLQINKVGRVTGRDLRQLAMVGFDVGDVFAKMNETMGTSIENHTQFNSMLRDGKISMEDFFNAFTQLAEDDFGGAAAKMAITLQGLKSTISDIFKLTIPQILEPTANLIGEFATQFIDDLQGILDSGILEELGEEVRSFAEDVLIAFDIELPGEEELMPDVDPGGFQVPMPVIDIEGQGRRSQGFLKFLGDLNDVLRAFRGQGIPGVLQTLADKDLIPQRTVTSFENLSEAFTNLKDSLESITEDIISPFRTLVEDILGEIKASDVDPLQIMADAMNKIATIIEENGEDITTFMRGFVGSLLVIAGLTMLKGILLGIAAGLSALASPALIAAVAVGAFALAWDKDWGGIRTELTDLADMFKTRFGEEIPPKMDELRGTIDEFSTAWSTFMTTLDKSSALATLQEDLFIPIKEAMKAEAVDWFVGEIGELVDNLNALGEAGTAIVTFMNSFARLSEMKKGEDPNLIQNLVKGITTGIGSLATITEGGPFWKFAVELPLKIGTMFGKKLGESLIAAYERLKEGGFFEKPVEMIREKIPDFKNIGVKLSEGLERGIKDGKSGVINAAVEVAKAAINAMEEELGIESPSVVMQEIGGLTAQGFNQGLEDNLQVETSLGFITSGGTRVQTRDRSSSTSAILNAQKQAASQASKSAAEAATKAVQGPISQAVSSASRSATQAIQSQQQGQQSQIRAMQSEIQSMARQQNMKMDVLIQAVRGIGNTGQFAQQVTNAMTKVDLE